MTHSDPVRPGGEGNDAAIRECGAGDSREGPPAAQRTLDGIADALDVTLALLGRRLDAGPRPRDATDARLAEAAALMQAFVGVSTPEARRRCIDFVRAAASDPSAPDRPS